MSDKNLKTKQEAATQEKNLMGEVIEQGIGVTDAELFDLMENPNTELQELNGGEYLKPEAGKVYVFKYVGNTDFTNKDGELVNCVQLLDREGKIFITGATLVVDALSKLTDIPAMCRITYNGKKKAANSNNMFDDFKIEVLPQVKK